MTSTLSSPEFEPTRCILTYSNQHQQIREIFERYWFLLTEDSILSSYVANKPTITFRKARSIKDELVNSHFVDPTGVANTSTHTLTCGNCTACPYLDTRNKVKLPNGETWIQKHSASCYTSGVIYLLLCPCGDFYVGKTCRSLATRITEHITSATLGFFKTAIGRHFALKHNYDFVRLKFLPLTVTPFHDCGGDWDRSLLQAESRWIFRLRADRPPGLNESLSFAPFL